ncbi:Zinc carboxypeptidase [Pedobacter westerhofensis]|uniref:Zinc carboxypeptidase n=2 Tax=Pedobacter westerhofensis TaxID=425512 RepID=A0A521CB61_9SPHI|nr:Zinc carboxypeptidase [Pedobacter westerhofensis]
MENMYNKFSKMFTLALLCTAGLASAQSIPSPKEYFGFNIGDDYKLTTYTQAEAYYKKLAASPRTKLVDIGMTEEGRHQWMLIVSSPENIKKLAEYKDISRKLAHAENLTPAEAKKLAAKGKAIVWIDGGLHATETVGAHQLIETMYQLVTRTDEETMTILNNDIILLAQANPDGQELVSTWYMRNADTLKRKLDIPRVYEKYVGHDNNRDFYMMNMKESQNISNQLFVEWIPQIMYNHHQRGPEGSVLAGPPYRDPFNYVFDPLIVTSIDGVGAAMNNRLNTENKPGYTQRNGSQFSTWWNGGLRTTPYFHNMVGLLTEIIGGPTPEDIALVPDRLIPNGATPNPVVPQKWHFRQSIDYSVSLNYGVLDYASRNRSNLLYNIYQMGQNSIARGHEDHWTFYPKYVQAIKDAYNKDKKDTGAEKSEGEFSFGSESGIPAKYFDAVMKNPELRDARAYIIPANQSDFPTAVRFINSLIRSGIKVERATGTFTSEGKTYPGGSYVVSTAQAFRPHVIDMFEPQDHPNDFAYEGGPPIKPYDAAGWTLAFQMGVKFDRAMSEVTGDFKTVPYGEIQLAPKLSIATAKTGYTISPKQNNAFIAVNDLLKGGAEVYRPTTGSTGEFYVPASAAAKTILAKSAAEYGVMVSTAASKPSGLAKITPSRIAIVNTYGGSIPAGWVRWLMEQYHYGYTVIYPNEVDAGDLNKKYDAIILVTGIVPANDKPSPFSRYFDKMPKADEVPDENKSWIGKISIAKSVPMFKKFLEAGGNIVTIGTSTNLAYHLGLPVKNQLVEPGKDGKDKPLPGTKYYIPGSLLTVSLDTKQPSNWGMAEQNDVLFDRSPVFKLEAGAEAKGIKPLAWFPTATPLHSGWAWGQAYLKDGVAAFEAPVGKGKLYAFGPEITFRGQSHSTFKMLFNELYGQKK